MKKKLFTLLISLTILVLFSTEIKAQITLLQDYQNYNSALIGTFQNIDFHEAGFSALYPIAGTNGKEFWTCSDRGVNVDAANANPSACRPTYDKIYSFPTYAPKIHRIRLNGDSIQILQTISMKRPDGTTATGIINPTGLGSTAIEVASTDTVLDCANFNYKIAEKDTFGIDSEGLVVDADGYFWICEEGGPTIWKLNKSGVVVKRFTPYANLQGTQSVDVQIDTVFKYRKNNRGFEGIAIAPNGKIYAVIQSPILYPTKAVGEGTRIHRILEIDPTDNSTQMFAYLNDGIIGGNGPNQIRLRDWKIGDMAAINNTEFLVLEAALRGTTDIKRIYKIDISGATSVTSGLYNGKTLEALVDAAGLSANGIVPVTKTLFMDLLANSWPVSLEKAEGLAIVNDSTVVICNDNDYGQFSTGENGVATASGIISHALYYRLNGSDKLTNYISSETLLAQGQTGPSTSQTPYLYPSIPGAQFTSILSAGDQINGYKMAGIPDGTGAFDNEDNTFTLLVNHEIPASNGIVRAHGSIGAFVSKWVINKSDLSVVSGSDLMQDVNLWNGSGYDTYNAGNPSSLAAFNRFCSGDLPAVSAFYNAASGLGIQERIYMNGEEGGTEGRAVAHIVTGSNEGTSYELPYLGKAAWENAVASTFASNKTMVGLLDDGAGGQIYFYIGTKSNSGTEIEKAGLTNGNLFGIAVDGLPIETSAGVPEDNTPFVMVDLGQVQNQTGVQLNTNSINAGVTTFLRPEDGAWDPKNPTDFYFATTNSFANPSRLWRLQFSDINNPELGGTITAVLDGTEGQIMLDNLTIDNSGHILLQEDVGNNAHIGKIWQYTIATDNMVIIGEHDSNRFLNGAPDFLTQDEESSGIIDVQSILGQGMFLLCDQAHYSIPGEIHEGGQLLAFFNPDSYNSNSYYAITLPFEENWESNQGTKMITGDIYSEPSYGWYFETDLSNKGRVKWGTNAYRTHNGTGALTMDKDFPTTSESINSSTLTMNLTNYTESTDLVLSFWWSDHGDEEHPGDKVWIRGSKNDEWIVAYDVEPMSNANNSFQFSGAIDIDLILSNASPAQIVGESFQVKFGQQDNGPTPKDGITFDDIIVYEVNYATANLPFFEGFEADNGSITKTDFMFIDSDHGWSFDTDLQGKGRARWGTNSYLSHTGAGALTMDKLSPTTAYSINSATLTINLENYTSSSDLELSFYWTDHGDEENPNDKVWIRGSKDEEWVEALDINPTTKPNHQYQFSGIIDIDMLLSSVFPNQTVSKSFQIRFGQEDNCSTPTDGISFDDITIQERGIPPVQSVLLAEVENHLEGNYELKNYPNPFTGTTTIQFNLERAAQTKLRVINTLGKEVAILYDGFAEANQVYKLEFNGFNLSSGIYFYHLQTSEGLNNVKKMQLIK